MTSLRTAKRFVFPLLGLWVLLYASFSMVRPPLLDGSDALSAEIAREIVATQHWMEPTLNGVPIAKEPPLLYWSVAISFELFGSVSDWAARVPMALATLVLFIATFSLGRRLFRSPAAAFYAALALLTSYGIFLFGHLLLRDVFLCLWTTLAINFFWRSLTQPRHLLASELGFGACCALGFLSEGFAGIVLPGAIALLYLVFTRKLRHLLRWQAGAAVLLFLAMVLPWHFAARSVSAQAEIGALLPSVFGGRVPLYIFWPLLLLWIVPWCAFSIRGLRIGPSSPNPCCRGEARLLSVLWILVVMVFFSFFARQEFDVITALPPMALLAGGWLAEDENLPHHQGRIAAWILFCFGIAAAGVLAWFLAAAPAPGSGVDIATLLHRSPNHHAVFFGYLLDLTRSAMGAFKVPLWITLAALLVGVSAGLWYRLRDNARMANCFLAGMIVAILIAAHLALNILSPVLSSAILAQAIKPEVRPDDAVIVNGPFANASSFAFYLGRDVQILDSHNPRLTTGSPVFVDQAGLTKLWSSPGRAWLWTTPATVPALPGSVYVIGRSGGKEILSNQPNYGGASF